MWTWRISDGELVSPEASPVVTRGYSGAGIGKNNPNYCSVHNVGPIPPGKYAINEPVDTLTHGPYVLPLSPAQSNEMFGRSGFLMHGDSVIHPGQASLGCVVVPRSTREAVWQSGDRELVVTA